MCHLYFLGVSQSESKSEGEEAVKFAITFHTTSRLAFVARLFTMRYYEKSLPDTDEVVMCQVRQIAEMGAYVKLLEYDDAEGMILLSELSRRRIRSIQKLVRVGRNEVVVVLRVDKEKGRWKDCVCSGS